jgi:hypothetical protein
VTTVPAQDAWSAGTTGSHSAAPALTSRASSSLVSTNFESDSPENRDACIRQAAASCGAARASESAFAFASSPTQTATCSFAPRASGAAEAGGRLKFVSANTAACHISNNRADGSRPTSSWRTD